MCPLVPLPGQTQKEAPTPAPHLPPEFLTRVLPAKLHQGSSPNPTLRAGAQARPGAALGAFVLPYSFRTGRSGQTEWQPVIGGRGAANQKGAPHAKARSFKRRAEGRARAQGSGSGEVPAWAGRHGSRPDSRGDWTARGFLASSQSPG